jgi:hypothetical protein
VKRAAENREAWGLLVPQSWTSGLQSSGNDLLLFTRCPGEGVLL